MANGNVNKNTIFNTLKAVFGVIYPLITFPYISRVLLTDNVGKLNYGNSIVSYASMIASLGVTTYAVRECSKVRNIKDELSKTASQIFSINILSTLFAYFVLAVVLVVAKPLENYRILILIQSTSIIFSTFGADWLNTAMEDFQFIAIRTVLMQALSLFLMFAFVHKSEDYIKFAIVSVVASSGANIANIFYRKKYCSTHFTWDMDARKHLPRIILLFSLILSQTIYVNSDITILGIIKGDHDVGLYSTSAKIYQIINTTVASVTWVVMPKLSYYFTKNNYEEVNKLLKYALNFIIVIGIPSICLLEIIAPYLIIFIAGEEYVDAALSLRILGFAMLFSFIAGWIGNMTFLPAGKELLCLKISSVSALVNIVLNFILIPKYGLNAAAFTTAVSELLGMLWGIFAIDKKIKIIGMPKMLITPAIGSFGILAVGTLSQLFFRDAFIVSLLTIIVGTIWYFIILLITKNEFFLGLIMPAFNRMCKRQ